MAGQTEEVAAAVAPHDARAEQAVVSSVLVSQVALETADRILDASDFYHPGLGHIYQAACLVYAAGGVVDAQTVAARLDDQKLLASVGGPGAILTLVAQAQVQVRHVEAHASRVIEMRSRRDLITAALAAIEAVRDGQDAVDAAEDAVERLRGLGGVDLSTRPDDLVRFEDWIESEENHSPWVIQGLMRSEWRMILTALPGAGKTTLSRQIAYAASIGIQPFRLDPIPPVRTLIVDLENPVSAVRETGRMMTKMAQDLFAERRWDPAECEVWSHREGINIRDRRDRLELERHIVHAAPQLVVIGPLYKAFRMNGREMSDQVTIEVCSILDDLRTRHNFALILEHHTSRDSASLVPFGSSVWERWPEFGKTLREDDHEGRRLIHFGQFRPDRVKVRWPVAFRWSTQWPFQAEWSEEP